MASNEHYGLVESSRLTTIPPAADPRPAAGSQLAFGLGCGYAASRGRPPARGLGPWWRSFVGQAAGLRRAAGPPIIRVPGYRLAPVLFLLLLAACSSGPAPPPELTAEAKAYVKNLQLAEVEMKAHESFMGSQLVEITGKITNNGGRDLQQVDLNCVFYDVSSQVVLRERVSIVRPKTGGLKPGDTKSFRLPFDTLPQSWNQAMPQMVIAGIVF